MIILVCLDMSQEIGVGVLCVGPFDSKEAAIDHVLGDNTHAREQVRADDSNCFRLNQTVFVACELDSIVEYINPGLAN